MHVASDMLGLTKRNEDMSERKHACFELQKVQNRSKEIA